MKKWRCTVCNYIHEGDEPPKKCPVCKVGPEKFVLLTTDDLLEGDLKTKGIVKASPKKELPEKETFLKRFVINQHIHPISVHIPNGVIPVSVVFVVLSALLNFSNLEQAAFYNMIFVVISMPMVIFSGYVGWKKKYGGVLTSPFVTKIICSVVVVVTAISLLVWHVVDPEIASDVSQSRWLFVLINLVMLGAASLAGFAGGKLVFRD